MRLLPGVTAALTIFGSTMLLSCGDRSKESDGMAMGAPAASAKSDSSVSLRDLSLSADAIQHGGIRWAPAVQRELAASAEVPGQLLANEDRTARLGAPAQGRVTAVHVQIGDRVQGNQPLVTLQSVEASTAQADYNKALADLNARRSAATYARSARERAERLLAAKAIPRQDVERATADDELAKAEIARAEAEVARTQAALRQLGVGDEGSIVVRSSIPGVVLSRDATPGAVVQAGAPLVAVSDPRTLWLDVAVPDQAVATLRTGGRVRFFVPAFRADTFSARVVSIGGALDSMTRTLRVRALVDNARGKLRAQMFATVWLDSGDRQTSIAVPEGAVMLLDERPVVFVARPDKNGSARFERRDVETGGTAGGMTRIVSGLAPGDLVVTDGAYAVKSEFSRSKMAGG